MAKTNKTKAPDVIKTEEENLRKMKNFLEQCKKELKRIQQVIVPIEFREIYHPEKS